MSSISGIFFILIGTIILQQMPDGIWASTEPVCSYKNADDERVFLKYFPLSKKGEDYVDFDKTGKCLRQATCNERFITETDECSNYSVTCSNKKKYPGVFPACCVKCN